MRLRRGIMLGCAMCCCVGALAAVPAETQKLLDGVPDKLIITSATTMPTVGVSLGGVKLQCGPRWAFRLPKDAVRVNIVAPKSVVVGGATVIRCPVVVHCGASGEASIESWIAGGGHSWILKGVLDSPDVILDSPSELTRLQGYVQLLFASGRTDLERFQFVITGSDKAFEDDKLSQRLAKYLRAIDGVVGPGTCYRTDGKVIYSLRTEGHWTCLVAVFDAKGDQVLSIKSTKADLALAIASDVK